MSLATRPPPVALDHPLAAAWSAMAGALPVPIFPLEAEPVWSARNWRSRPDLLEGDGALLDRCLASVAAAHGGASRTVAARFWIDGYAWSVIGAAVAGYAGGRRIPDLRGEAVAVCFGGDGYAEAVALREGRFACLPDDPAAAHPDAEVVPDLDALRGALRAGVEAHFAPLIEALRRRSSLAERALWLGLADHCVRLYLEARAQLDPDGYPARRRHEVDAEVAALIQSAGSPLRGPTGVLWIDHAGGVRPWVRRAACCLGYHDPDHGRCDHCPAFPVPEQLARLRAALAAEAGP